MNRPSELPGLLVSNLGTPDAPTAPALRSYLGEFLADPDVVTLPRLLWWPILHGLVLRTRPQKSAEAYARIWTPAGSPLLVHTRTIAAALGTELATRTGNSWPLALGMRYGKPSLHAALSELRAAGVTRLAVLPLYPQYAEATTGSTRKALTRTLGNLRWTPEVRFIESYQDHPGYIAALAASVREYWQTRGRGEQLLLSFHGIPRQVADRGDPYPGQCATSARLFAAALDLKQDAWQLTFQSRFGPAEWLTPYTDESMKILAAAGVKTVDVVCPGFAADCLETLEEIALRYAEVFREAGGAELRYLPALNARHDHVAALADVVQRALAD
ncbi:MAG: ferrochelatase [Gammaproteobacteria bacterium]